MDLEKKEEELGKIQCYYCQSASWTWRKYSATKALPGLRENTVQPKRFLDLEKIKEALRLRENRRGSWTSAQYSVTKALPGLRDFENLSTLQKPVPTGLPQCNFAL